ncbi:MAG TPA: MotA/TolQ/ExbB proton channel family protein [Methylophilaceae bacterium]|nr:MotA/TolQ/ExbB proton channel family protein [Methylophilaceae bacterium]
MHGFDGLAFVAQGGPVSIGVALILLVMSVASWYLMLTKGWRVILLRKAVANYCRAFWLSPSLQAALDTRQANNPAWRLTSQAVEAAEHYQQHAAKRLPDACSHDEFVARAMRRVIGEETARLESGLSVLASVGSVAPFVGLFGTVWGIYHALASISASGQATLDKVAGPVGEALIMTALGLAVAIPAVLAYNALVRSNRVLLGRLDHFGQDLLVLLTTGAPLAAGSASSAERTSAKPAMHLKEVPA